MAEMNIKNTWKGINTSPSISKDPVIGMVYSAQFHNKQVVGVLQYVGGVEAHLRTRDNKVLSVGVKSLKIIINE
jgi:hypothetical protein